MRYLSGSLYHLFSFSVYFCLIFFANRYIQCFYFFPLRWKKSVPPWPIFMVFYHRNNHRSQWMSHHFYTFLFIFIFYKKGGDWQVIDFFFICFEFFFSFPEVEFFHTAPIQEMMIDLLFCFCKTHTELSYKQVFWLLTQWPDLWTGVSLLSLIIILLDCEFDYLNTNLNFENTEILNYHSCYNGSFLFCDYFDLQTPVFVFTKPVSLSFCLFCVAGCAFIYMHFPSSVIKII